MEKNPDTEQRNAERRILKKYLARYYKAKKQQGILNDRLQRMRSEFSRSASEPKEIEAKIKAQKQAAEKSVLQITGILELLPAESTERIILELRHLDCLSWSRIQRTVYLTSSPCFEWYNKGLDALLRFDQVRAAIGLPKKGHGN